VIARVPTVKRSRVPFTGLILGGGAGKTHGRSAHDMASLPAEAEPSDRARATNSRLTTRNGTRHSIYLVAVPGAGNVPSFARRRNSTS
jgi:hypothetical protein